MTCHQPTWLDEIDDRLHEIFQLLACARPFELIQQRCRALLTDCTAEPYRITDGPSQCVPPRFISYGWDSETPLRFDCTPGLSAFAVHFGPTEDDLKGEKGYYFAEAFERMFDFVVSPLPRVTQATALK